MGFSFTATAKCDYCGQLLSDSDEECDHDGHDVQKHVFRRMGEGRDSIVGVETTARYKWYKLAHEVGEDWIGHEYLGEKGSVNAMLAASWESVEDLPKQAMSLDAPRDVNDTVFDE
jgi:hypothetical protein